MSGKRLLPLFCILALLTGFSTEEETNLYRFPLEGRDFLLSGTFGELRTNHFHSGIDVKTGGQSGKPLYAARDGYLYRIKVSPYGFGKAIYLRHPDEEFTVYAHMQGFTKEIEDFVYQRQYATKQFTQEIYPEKDQFPVSQGALIGYSGNSGSSSGPHLHYEIRDPQEKIKNPLPYYRNLVRDNKPPVVNYIGFEPQDIGSRVNGSFEKVIIEPTGSPGLYRIPQVMEFAGSVGIEYNAYDLLDGAGNHCGINYVRLFLDGELIYQFGLDKYDFEEKRYINVHFDYPYYQRFRKKFQKAYLDHGNKFPGYSNLVNRGLIELKDEGLHNMRLELSDAFSNTTVITGRIRKTPPDSSLPSSMSARKSSRFKCYERRNTLVFKVSNASTAHLKGLNVTWTDQEQERLKPAYVQDGDLIYLLPLNKWRYPTRVTDPVSGKNLDFRFRKTILPDKHNIVELGELQLFFPRGAIFDSLQLQIKKLPGKASTFSQLYYIGNRETPLFRPMVVNLKPYRKGNQDHLVLARMNKYGKWVYLGREQKEDGSIFASSSEFGTFCVMADSTPPKIIPQNFSDGKVISRGQKNLKIKITDNFSGVQDKKVMVTLDGDWILCEYDFKRRTFTHRFKNRPGPGSHVLEVMAYDQANNLSQQKFILKF